MNAMPASFGEYIYFPKTMLRWLEDENNGVSQGEHVPYVQACMRMMLEEIATSMKRKNWEEDTLPKDILDDLKGQRGQRQMPGWVIFREKSGEFYICFGAKRKYNKGPWALNSAHTEQQLAKAAL